MVRISVCVLFYLVIIPAVAASGPLPERETPWSLPELQASVVLDAISIEDDRTTSATTFYPATDRFYVREASLEVTGRYGDRLSYEITAGTAACQGTAQFQLLEAGVLYDLAPALQVGFTKGHVVRGFAMYEECIEQLAAEKPVFNGVLSPCHPTGFVAEWQADLGSDWSAFTQLAALNGSAGTLEHESDLNLGTIVQTPLSPLAVSLYANRIEFLTGDYDQWGQQTSADGNRWGAGCRWHEGPLQAQVEHYWACGFPAQVIGPASNLLTDQERLDHFADWKMRAWYAQLGLAVATGWQSLPDILPYVRFQSWNRDVSGSGDSVAEYLTLGVVSALAGDKASLRFEYERQMTTPAGSQEEADRLIARIQFTL